MQKLREGRSIMDTVQGQAKRFAGRVGAADRDKLDPILDACVATYREQLDEDGQVDFKGKAKAFTRSVVRLTANNREAALRGIIVKVTFDGERAIEAPLRQLEQ